MANVFTIGILLVLCGLLGSLPFTGWLAGWIAGLDLSQVGTGNVSVAAAFRQGGPKLGIPVVLVEIGRGILPLGLATGLGLSRVWGLWGLIPVVVARFGRFRAGGATNWGWGLLIYDPVVFGLAGLTGLGLWPILASRRWGIRLGWLSAGIWAWILARSGLAQWGGSRSGADALAMLAVALTLVLIDLRLEDDMAAQSIIALRSASDPAQVGSKAATLSQLLSWGYRVPEGWAIPAGRSVEDWLDRIPVTQQNPLIVRSSALEEDGEAHSSAGVYQSIGPVTSREALRQAALACLQSYHSPVAQAYRAQWNLPERGMALVVQPYVTGQVMGVMFSRQPLDGSPLVVIEASSTQDPSVVSGAGIPLHLEIPHAGDGDLGAQTLLPGEVIEALVKLAQELEARFHGIPQDIEWIWDGQHITVVQCRPITNLRPIWTRTIAAEVIPGAIRPLTWSINRPLTCGVWGELFGIVLGDRVAGLDFDQTATLLGSHAYFNATLLGAIFRQMGLPEQGLEFLLRGGKMGKPPRSAYRRLLSCLPGLWRLIQLERNLPQGFEADQQAHFQPTLTVLAQVSTDQLTQTELWGLIQQLQDLLKRATLYNIVSPIGFAIRRSLFRISDRWIQDTTSPESQATAALQTLAHRIRDQATQQGIPVSALLSDQVIQDQLQAILETYGFLSEVGTDIAIPCWREQPRLVESILLRMAGTQPKVPDPVRLNLWQKWRLARCQPRLDLKGEVAQVYAKLLAHLRWAFVTLEQRWIQAGILVETGDIFFLELKEIESLIESKSPSKSLADTIQERKVQFEQDQNRPIPTVVYGSRLPAPSPAPAENTAQRLTGIPGSAGEVVGKIQVLKSLSDLSGLEGADDWIWVVPYTDAGWSPLLATAVGLITEVGGQLSHGAILAREYGIPAVMNVSAAMTQLKSGQTVRLNGTLGQIEILD